MSGDRVYGWKPAGSGSCSTLQALHVSVSQPGPASLTGYSQLRIKTKVEPFGSQSLVSAKD